MKTAFQVVKQQVLLWHGTIWTLQTKF